MLKMFNILKMLKMFLPRFLGENIFDISQNYILERGTNRKSRAMPSVDRGTMTTLSTYSTRSLLSRFPRISTDLSKL